MDTEHFANLHPIAYVHISYAVVWVFHFGFALWILAQWRKLSKSGRP